MGHKISIIYLDDFFFVGESNTDNCKRLMKTFDHVCERLGVPIAKEKNEGPINKNGIFRPYSGYD